MLNGDPNNTLTNKLTN